VAAVIAPNGLGHARRTLGILARFAERGGRPAVTVLGTRGQQEAAARWGSHAALERAGCTWIHDVTEPGVSWTRDGSAYDDGRLLAWEDRLARVDEVAAADVVLSDNLAGVLGVRPDALLAGSFLWSDVLDAAHGARPAVAAFVERERSLLLAHRPPMVCVDDLVMPGVVERTTAWPVGWMCADPDPGPHRSPARPTVGVLGGATGAADALLGPVADALARAGTTVRSGLGTDPGIRPFDGTASSWADLVAVVGRPGVGTLTDAVQRQIPVVCLHEGDNVELAHNARRVAELGIGRDLGASPRPDAVVEAVADQLAEPARSEAAARLAARDRSGLEGAAEWLAVHSRVTLEPRRVEPSTREEGGGR
jgi:hypothetical protein